MLLLLGCVPALEPPDLPDNPNQDWDGDGVSEREGDCDDLESQAAPGLADVCGDGVENDCDGSPGQCGYSGSFSLSGTEAYIQGAAAGERTGASLASADFSKNGQLDLWMGQPGAKNDKGAISMVYEVGQLVGENVINDTKGFYTLVYTAARQGDSLGWSIAGGDLDDNSFLDLVAGAPFVDAQGYDSNGYVVGALGPYFQDAFTRGGPGFDGARLGAAMIIVGDMSGDGVQDLVVSAPGDQEERGFVLRYSHDVGDGAAYGEVAGDLAGTSLAGAGDVNGDGLYDILVGAPGVAGGDGAAYVQLGPIVFPETFGPGSHTTWTGRDGERLGEAAATLPDLDDDGLPELAVAGVGSVYLLSTPSSGGSVEAISGYGRVDLEGTGRRALSSVADANGDGAPELIVGMPDALDLAGMVCIFEAGSGVRSLDDAQACAEGEAAGDEAGFAVLGLGDVTGDGLGDIAIGAPGAAGAGRVYLLWGGVP